MTRRVLHVPAQDLRPGDRVSFRRWYSDIPEATVTESRLCKDNDGTWYLAFDQDRYTDFPDCCEQYTLLLDL